MCCSFMPSQIHGLLQDIQDLAAREHAEEAEAVAVRVGGTARSHRRLERSAAASVVGVLSICSQVLRDVVRLDPTRVLTHRLREQISGGTAKCFALRIAAAPPIRLLRTVEVPVAERPAVRRRSADRERR